MGQYLQHVWPMRWCINTARVAASTTHPAFLKHKQWRMLDLEGMLNYCLLSQDGVLSLGKRVFA